MSAGTAAAVPGNALIPTHASASLIFGLLCGTLPTMDKTAAWDDLVRSHQLGVDRPKRTLRALAREMCVRPQDLDRQARLCATGQRHFTSWSDLRGFCLLAQMDGAIDRFHCDVRDMVEFGVLPKQ